MIAWGWWLVAAAAWAETPLDLDSPFQKTVILENRLGKQEEFEILQAKVVGENFEMVKLDSSLLLAPRKNIRAVLPKLPADGARYTQKDAQKALALLRAAQREWPDRPETSARALALWEKLAADTSPLEREKDALRTAAVQQWLGKIEPEDGKPRSIDLQAYAREGEQLASSSGPEAKEVQERLERVRNLMAMDFREIRGKWLPTEWFEINILLPLGLAGLLLILGLWVLGNLSNFSSAIKAGVVRSVQKGGESHTTFNLRGLVYLVYAAGGVALIVFLLRSGPLPKMETISESSAGVAERAIYLSMNTHKRWSTQSKGSLEVEAAAMTAGLQKMLPAGEFRLNQVLAYAGPRIIWSDGRLFWRQSLKLAFVPVCLDFVFRPSAERFLLEKPTVGSCRIGQIPVGGWLGRLLWDQLDGVTLAWDQALGLQNGAVWSWVQGDMFRVDTPSVTSRRDERKQGELAGKKKAIFQKNITALELAQVFADGDGDVYLNRTIDLTGQIISVSSMQLLGNDKPAGPRGLDDSLDAFFLDTRNGEGTDAKIKVKVLVKSDLVYRLDNRGDLYASEANPNKNHPIVPRHKKAFFSGGRVEGIEKNVIEVYDAAPPVEVP